MRPRTPELLLVFYIFLPMRSPLVAPVLLCQIKAIHAARKAEEKLIQDLDLDNDTDQALRGFLGSFWLNPDNAMAYAYLAMLAPHLGLFNQPMIEIRRKIAKKKLEYSKHAVDQSILNQIKIDEVEEAIVNGKLIEENFTPKGSSSYLICGLTEAGRPLHIKCSDYTRPLIKIISVYEPDSERWDEDFTIRRTNNNDER